MGKIIQNIVLGIVGMAVVMKWSVRDFRRHHGCVIVAVRPRARDARRCPVCGRRCPVYDTSTVPRYWRTVDQGSRICWLEYAPHRVACPEHGIAVEAIPWARRGSRFTRGFEDTLAWLACSMPKSKVCEYMTVDWDTVGSCCQRVLGELEATAEDRLRGLVHIGMDETGWGDHKVMTIVVDLDTGALVWAHEGVGKEAIDGFFGLLSRRQRRAIESVSGDGAEWVDNARRRWCRQAKRIMDPFHVVQSASAALEDVRRAFWSEVHSRYEALMEEALGGRWERRKGRPSLPEGSPQASAYADAVETGKLADAVRKAKYALLKKPGDLSEEQEDRRRMVEAEGGELWRAYVAKEEVRALFMPDADGMPKTGGRVRGDLHALIDSLLGCGYPRLAKLAKSLMPRTRDIANAVAMGLGNSLSESTNSKIDRVITNARGFRNFGNMRAMLMLTCSPTKPELPRELMERLESGDGMAAA